MQILDVYWLPEAEQWLRAGTIAKEGGVMDVKTDVEATLVVLMDDLIAIGVPIETIRVVAAAVRQAVTDAPKKTPPGPAPPKGPRGFQNPTKAGA
jgi:hypothetical protein